MKPNIIFIMIDDMGWRDLGCYGSSFYETPHIDRLCREGMAFTNAYAACPVCSPSRASYLTGKYPAVIGLTDYIGGHNRGKLIDAPYIRYLPKERRRRVYAITSATLLDHEAHPAKRVNIPVNGASADAQFTAQRLDILWVTLRQQEQQLQLPVKSFLFHCLCPDKISLTPRTFSLTLSKIGVGLQN